MKKLILFALIASPLAFAQATCLGEAQIIAQVAGVKNKTMLNCSVEIDPATIRHYSESMVCPLGIDEVLAEGIEVGLKDGHDCRLERGDTLSGIVVRSAATGKIILE